MAISHADGRSLRMLVLARFTLLPRRVPPTPPVASSAQAIRAVVDHPGAIAYVSLGEATLAARAGRAIRLLPLAGVAPTPENVEQGAYPIARPLALIVRVGTAGAARRFVDLACSAQVHQLVRDQGFVPAHGPAP
jgi:phosphate transport system substrate-binding protein